MIGNIPNPLQAFTWGDSGQAMTPEQVARRRAMAAMLQQDSSSTAPLSHWTQVAARGLGGYLSGRSERIATRAENEGLASADEAIAGNPILSALMGGQGQMLAQVMPAQSSVGQALMASAPAMAQEARVAPGADAVRAGLVQRGLPPHVADAFVMNFQDESGLNPGIEEREFNVHGTKGFGLAQWTGPRRRQLEAFARQRGTPVSDVDTQLDFLMTELQGSEAGAARSILSAPDAGTAAAAIVNNFLRPAEEHRARRVAEYTGGGGGVSTNASGMIQAPAQAPSGVVAALAQAQANPWVAQKYGPVIEALMGQEIGRQDAAYQQSLRQADPMYQSQLRGQELANQQALNPVNNAPASFQALDMQAQAAGLMPGTPEYQSFMLNGGAGGSSAPAAFQALDLQAQAAGFMPGTPEYQEFMASRGAGYVAQAGAEGRARGEAVVNMDSAIQNAERSIANLQAIRDDPALGSITGMLQGRMPPMRQAGTDLNTRIQQAQGAAFLEAFESLKGGGAITEIEGTKAEQAMARLQRTQSEEAFKTALNELIDILNIGMGRARSRAGQPPEAPAAPQRRRYNPQTGAFE